MAYLNEIPTAQKVEILGSAYTYSQIVDAIERANALNVEYERVYEDVATRVYASFSSTDFIYMSIAERQTDSAFCGLVNSGLDGINVSGAIGRGSCEFWPVARIEKDIKRLQTMIKRIEKFGEAF